MGEGDEDACRSRAVSPATELEPAPASPVQDNGLVQESMERKRKQAARQKIPVVMEDQINVSPAATFTPAPVTPQKQHYEQQQKQHHKQQHEQQHEQQPPTQKKSRIMRMRHPRIRQPVWAGSASARTSRRLR